MKRGLLALNAALLALCVVVSYRPLLDTVNHPPLYDLKNFYACTDLLARGGNPYDPSQMIGQYSRLYHVSRAYDHGLATVTPCLQSPLTFALVMPLLRLPIPVSFALWEGLLVTCLVAAAILVARLWAPPNAAYRSLIFMLSPVAVAAVLLGQVDVMLLLLWTLALWWAYHERHAYAGAALMLGLMKPQMIAGPIILVGVIAWRHRALRSYLAGLGAGLLVVTVATVLVGGLPLVREWLAATRAFSGTEIVQVADLSSVTGFYIAWLPRAVTVLPVLQILLWLALCALLWRRVADVRGERWWLGIGITTWLLATPYAHSHDLVMLLPALALLWSYPSFNVRASRAELTTWAVWWVFSLVTFLHLAAQLDIIRGFGAIPPIVIALILWRHRPPGALNLPAPVRAGQPAA